MLDTYLEDYVLESEYDILCMLTDVLIKESTMLDYDDLIFVEGDTAQPVVNQPTPESPSQQPAPEPNSVTQQPPAPKPTKQNKIKAFITRCWNTIVNWFKQIKEKFVSVRRKSKSQTTRLLTDNIMKAQGTTPSNTEGSTEQPAEPVNEYMVYYEASGGGGGSSSGSSSPKKASDPDRKEIFDACEGKMAHFHTRLRLTNFQKNSARLCGALVSFSKSFENVATTFQISKMAKELDRSMREINVIYDDFHHNSLYRRQDNTRKHAIQPTFGETRDKSGKLYDSAYLSERTYITDEMKNTHNGAIAWFKGDKVALGKFADYYDKVMIECDKICKQLLATEKLVNQAKIKFDTALDDLTGNTFSVASRFGSDVISQSAVDNTEYMKKCFATILHVVANSSRIVHDVEAELDTEVSYLKEFAETHGIKVPGVVTKVKGFFKGGKKKNDGQSTYVQDSAGNDFNKFETMMNEVYRIASGGVDPKSNGAKQIDIKAHMYGSTTDLTNGVRKYYSTLKSTEIDSNDILKNDEAFTSNFKPSGMFKRNKPKFDLDLDNSDNYSLYVFEINGATYIAKCEKICNDRRPLKNSNGTSINDAWIDQVFAKVFVQGAKEIEYTPSGGPKSLKLDGGTIKTGNVSFKWPIKTTTSGSGKGGSNGKDPKPEKSRKRNKEKTR